MSWEKEIEELRQREALAKKMGGAEKVARQKENGRLTVRERIDRLLDEGSFHEIGATAGKASYDAEGNLTGFMPANFVVGRGRIDGRTVIVGGDDFTVRGGASDASIAAKQIIAEQMANEFRLPLVRVIARGDEPLLGDGEGRLTDVHRRPAGREPARRRTIHQGGPRRQRHSCARRRGRPDREIGRRRFRGGTQVPFLFAGLGSRIAAARDAHR